MEYGAGGGAAETILIFNRREKYFCHFRDSNPGSSSSQPLSILTTLFQFQGLKIRTPNFSVLLQVWK
jgi:hypothetical protein